MIDDAATEDHLKQIIILAGIHEMTEDVPTENIQVDFKALLRKAQAVTSKITVSSVLPVIKGNAVNLGGLIEVNDQLKSTCDEMDVKFVDNDTNFTFRNGTVDFTTLNKDGIHLAQSGTGRLMTNLSLPKPQRQNTHDRPTREAVQATRGASTTSDWTVVGRRSVPHPLGRRSVPTPIGRRRCQLPSDGGRCQLPSDGGRCQTYVTRLDSVQSVVKLTTLGPHVDTPRKLCAESAVNQATKTNITLMIRTSAYKNGPLIYIQTYCVTCNNARLR